MILRQIFLVLFSSFASAASCAQGLPIGWRFPVSGNSMIDASRITLSMVNSQADFNGDGKMDDAYILIQEIAPNNAGVFVFVSSVDQNSEAEKLEEYQISAGEFMLSTIDKGCYSGPQRTLCLSSPALLRSEIEYGWSTLYYMENGKWERISFARGEFSGL